MMPITLHRTEAPSANLAAFHSTPISLSLEHLADGRQSDSTITRLHQHWEIPIYSVLISHS